jgi:hypothetical protein
MAYDANAPLPRNLHDDVARMQTTLDAYNNGVLSACDARNRLLDDMGYIIRLLTDQ